MTTTNYNIELNEEENNMVKQAVAIFSDITEDMLFDDVEILGYLGENKSRTINQKDISQARKEINEVVDKLLAIKGLKEKLGM